MASVELFDKERQVMETVELPESVFGASVKTHLLHQVVVARRNAARSGSAATKTRAAPRSPVAGWRCATASNGCARAT